MTSTGLSVRGVSWTYVLYPWEKDKYRIELQSLPGSINVKDIMHKTGFGGGHLHASSGMIGSKGKVITYEDALLGFTRWLEEHQPHL